MTDAALLVLNDCPGSDDFVGGAVTALNMTDAALLVLNTQYGIEVGTQNSFRLADKYNKPIVFVLNQLDHEKAEFDRALEQLKEAFGSKVMPLQFPVETGPGFNAIVDVLEQKLFTWKAEGGEPQVGEIPDNLKAKAEAYHAALIEAAAENDEALMEKFFEDGTLNSEEIRKGIQLGLAAKGIFPVVCVCGGNGVGVSRLLDFMKDIAPSVLDVPAPKNSGGVEVAPDANAPCSLYFFKTSVEPHIGEVCYFKVMSGKVKEGDDLQNTNRSSRERITQLFCTAGANRIKVEELQAGDMGATVKLKDLRTGNTLNAKGVEHKFDFIKFPDPKYRRAVKPVNEADMEKMMTILNRMHEEDPTYIIEQSKELRQTIVHGQGEFHLRTLKWIIENIDKLAITFAEPRIPYRETITKSARADYRHKKQSGGAGQFGEVHLIVEPYTEGMPIPEMFKFGGQEYKIGHHFCRTQDSISRNHH
jgi:elongation factor G